MKTDMKPQWIIPLFVSLTLGAGCSSGDVPLELDYPEGQGAIHLSLDSSDPILGTLHGLIRISRGATTVTERELDPGGRARTYDIIYLGEGVYDVEVRLEDDEGNLAMFGERTGVHVVPGQLTSITIVLQSSGGVQVEVELPGVPTRFTKVWEGHVPDCVGGFGPFWLGGGTQRVDAETGETRYYAWVKLDDGFANLLQASSPQGLGESDCTVTSLSFLPSSFACAGSHFYSVTTDWWTGSIFVYRSDDGVDWGQMSRIDPSLASFDYDWGDQHLTAFDSVRSCSILVDNQFNLFCHVRDAVDSESLGMRNVEGIAAIYSRDGVVWSPFPYQQDNPGAMELIAERTEVRPMDDHFLFTPTYFSNTYNMWINQGSYDCVEAPCESYVISSTDRLGWSEPLELNLPEFSYSKAIYLTERGVEILVMRSSGDLYLYQEE